MRKRILASVLACCCAAVLLAAGCLAAAVYGVAMERTTYELNALVDALAEVVNANGQDSDLTEISKYAALEGKTGTRVTWIAADGSVLYDNFAQPSGMENHAQRKEFIDALATGRGSDTRASGTLRETYVYCAVRLDDGAVLRVSRSARSVLGLLNDMKGTLALALLALIAGSIIVSRRVSDAIVKPLGSLDLEHPENNVTYDELAPLLRRIDAQNGNLNAKIDEIDRQRRQLEEITHSMREGLIVLDAERRVLSCNQSACRLLGISDAPRAGAGILELTRNPAVLDIFRADTIIDSVVSMDVNGQSVELHTAPVRDGRAVQGYVLLMVDITGKQEAETMRKTFSANVSHELKTPLTSISGYAELLARGNVGADDARGFAERIYKESQRMIMLIDDIIRLSKLDENELSLPREDLDLYTLAEDVLDAHVEQARRLNVKLELHGDQAYVSTVRQLAWELLNNVVDNAIKYNKENGTVTVSVSNADNASTVTVSDTGIGIPESDTEKVFERFYRVDKSRSKATGGTGLGLSIVKHAAAYLNVTLTLESTLGQGTTMTATFPEV